jgi:hypothetical protein
MKTLRKLAIVAGLLALCACASYRDGQGGDKGGQTDCSTVRCAACPEGQRPALTPPDCCKCVPV